MALLDNMLDPTWPQPPIDPTEKGKAFPELVHKLALADLVDGVARGAQAGQIPSPPSNEPIQPVATANLGNFGQQQQPYMGQTQAPPQPQTSASEVIRGPGAPAQPSFWDRLQGLAQGYNQGGLLGGVATAFGAQQPLAVEQQNQTVQALTAKGLDPATAKAAAMNPEVLKQVLPLVFPPKAPEFQKLQPGESLVSTQLNPQGQPVVRDVTPNGEGDLSGKTPTSRVRLAAQFGLRPGTPEYNGYILNGKLPDVTPDHKAIGEADAQVLQSKHLIEDLNKALQLSGNAYSGVGAETRALLARQIPGTHQNAEDTADYANLISSSILPALKSIFPGRVTNADLKLMQELQGSASYPQNVRENIVRRGIARAQEILAEKQAQSEALRSGGYYKPGGNPVPVTAAGQANLKAIEDEARAAIAAGADPEKVKQRYQQLVTGGR